MEQCLICINPKWPPWKLTESFFGDISANNQWRIMIFVSKLMFLEESNDYSVEHPGHPVNTTNQNILYDGYEITCFCNMTIILLCLTWLLMTWTLWLFYNKHVIVSVVRFQKSLGPTIQSPGGGGGGVFVADKLFISTKLGGTLKISNFNICSYRTVLDVNYLFHRVYPKLYIKKLQPPPPVNWMVALLTHSVGLRYMR